MDEGLFAKHIRLVLKRNNDKETIIRRIQEVSGVLLDESEVSLSQKRVTITTTSVKRARLFTQSVREELAKDGYTLNSSS